MKSKKAFVFEEKNRKRGFTLIEILVAVSIVGVLAGLALVSMGGAKKSARDGRRKADLQQIASALEMYRSDNGTYPKENYCDSSRGYDNTHSCSCSNPPSGNDWGPDMTDLEPNYIGDLPRDPINNSTYFYYYEPICGIADLGEVCGRSVSCPGTNANCCAYEIGAVLETTGECYKVCSP